MDTPIELHTLPPLWGSPGASPFSIKLETGLRMAGIPYVCRYLSGPPRSATGKIPYVALPDGRTLHDSGLILATLTRERGLDLDAGLSPQALATGHALRRMLEEHLYYVAVCDRWVTDEGFAHTARDYFAHVPWPMRWILPRLLRRSMRSYAHAQGVGRHPPEVRAELARADLRALAALLADQEFVLGRPSTIDATVTGFLWAYKANPFPSAVGEALREQPSLLAYLDRMRARYWADWKG